MKYDNYVCTSHKGVNKSHIYVGKKKHAEKSIS